MLNRKVITAFFTALGALFYRLGGSSAGTLWRDCGVSALFCLVLALLGGIRNLKEALSLLPCFGALWGALTTYRYFLPKPSDYKWWHYSMHGFFCSLAAVFYAWASEHWLWFAIRVVICTVFMALWYFAAKWNDWLHEGGRGAVLIATVPLLTWI